MELLLNAKLKKIVTMSSLIFIVGLLGACGAAIPAPTVTAPQAPSRTLSSPSMSPSPSNTLTQTSTITSLSICTPLSTEYVFVIGETVYLSDAGIELGVKEAVNVLQQALDEHHPEWAREDGLALYVWNHSGAQMIGVNPRVLLVTVGMSLDWQIPVDHDLREDVLQVGVALTQHYRDFRFDEDLQANYPQIANAGSYALYAFFGYDLEKLETWHQEYDRMFGDIQPRINISSSPCTTPTPIPSSTPYSCELSDENTPWIILDYDTFHAFGATPNEMDEQLIQRNNQWQSFQQTVTTNPWTAGAVFDQGHGAPGEYGVNPAVLMVTVGMELDWQVPPDGDLYGRVVETGKTLYTYYLEYYTQEDVRDAYPQIGNAATYALYRFFNEDLKDVEEWCETFHEMFGDHFY